MVLLKSPAKWENCAGGGWMMQAFTVAFQPKKDIPWDVFKNGNYINSFPTFTQAKVYCEKQIGL